MRKQPRNGLARWGSDGRNFISNTELTIRGPSKRRSGPGSCLLSLSLTRHDALSMYPSPTLFPYSFKSVEFYMLLSCFYNRVFIFGERLTDVGINQHPLWVNKAFNGHQIMTIRKASS